MTYEGMTVPGQRSWPWRSVAPDGDAVVTAGFARVCAVAEAGWQLGVGAFPPVLMETPLRAPERVRVAAHRIAREGAVWTESMVVAPDRAAVVCAFARGGEDTGEATWSIVVRGDLEIRFDAERRVILVRDDAALLLAVDRDVSWRVHRAPGRCRLSFTTIAPVRIVAGACDPDGTTSRAVDAVVRDPLLADRIADADVRRRGACGPALDAPCRPSVAGAFEWSRVRLSWHDRADSGDDLAWQVMGAQASGDCDVARVLLSHLDESASDSLAVLAWSRYVAWTADTAALADARTALIERLGRLAAPDFERAGPRVFADAAGVLLPSRAACVVAALREGAVLAESLGDAALAALLASRARRAPAAYARAFDGGAFASAVDDDAALTAALGVSHADRPAADLSTVAWADLEAGRIRRGTVRVAQAADALLDDVGASRVGATAAARYALAVVSGLIGWWPDAVRDRVRLRPRLTDAFLPFSVRGLRAGESAFDLDVVRDGPRFRVTIEQTSGAVPLNLVVEAWFPDAAFTRVSVDGRAAELDARPLDGGWILPVQVVPDGPRTLEVVGAHER